ncbi:amidohydrolase family protein [Dactylosporangium sp. NBC_01737]|uniref:amidohydrolase family protein n=1 Tax=Dactylosporangium sp. NBC_01737 TaxID=2975959 RepID=UPI002E11B105|nr:amidohydrolase family protein [Dactylosporangium sp. NBC_01737]
MDINVSRRALLGTGVGIGAGLVVGTPAAAATTRPAVAVVGCTVIDATGAPPRHDMTVVARGDRITDLGPARTVRVPGDAAVVDGRRRFVIPGLTDMHVHSSGIDTIDPPLFIANGVTTVREMSGYPTLHEWRQRVADGTLLGPRSVIASPLIDGSPSLWTGLGAPYVEVADAEQARAAVRQVAADGADFVKVYSRLSRESFTAIAQESHRLGLQFAGHCPDDVPVTAAADLGQRSFEHVFTSWYATSRHEDEIRRALSELTVEAGDYNGWLHRVHPLELAAARGYDPRRAARVFARLRARDAHQTPTLVMHRVLDLPGTVDQDDPRLRYIPAEVRAAWDFAMQEIYLDGRTPQEAAGHQELFGHRGRFVGALHRAGVPLLAGTDTGTSYVYPGFSLHDELELLVRAGVPAMRALQAATRDAARFLGLGSGTVRREAPADLVVLDADPLADIRNTRHIHAVVVRGELITAERRDTMLEAVAAAAGTATQVPARIGCRC